METSCADDTTTVLQENPATGQTERPAELKVSDRFDRCIDLSLQRLVYGTLAGGLAGMIFFSTSEGHESTATPAATDDSPPRNAHVSLVLDSPRHASPSICAPAGGMAGSARRENSVFFSPRSGGRSTDGCTRPSARTSSPRPCRGRGGASSDAGVRYRRGRRVGILGLQAGGAILKSSFFLLPHAHAYSRAFTYSSTLSC